MKTQIIVSIVLDFLKGNILTAKQLSIKYNVNIRTIYRYIDEISLTLPIYAIRGNRGGTSYLNEKQAN